MPLTDLPLAAVLDVVRGAIMVLFIISAFLVILVVLAQEGKGGGLAGAFGGAGAETFGVKAGTVNKFTAWLAAMFLGLALLHAGLSTATAKPAKPDMSGTQVPADGEDAGSKGAEDPNQDDGDADAPKDDAPKDDGAKGDAPKDK